MRPIVRNSIVVLAMTGTIVGALLSAPAASAFTSSPASTPPSSEFPQSSVTPDPTAPQTPPPGTDTGPVEETQVVPSPTQLPESVPSDAPPEASPSSPTPPIPDETSTPTPAPTAAPRQAVPNTVQCFGDSMINSLCATGVMSSALPGFTVVNNADGGMTSPAIATMAGVYPLSLSRDVTIPSSGSVKLGQPNGLPVSAGDFGRFVMDTRINGIDGRITHRPDLAESSLQWSFTRTSSGAATLAKAGAALESLDMPLPGATSIIWAGTNNLFSPAQIKRDIAAMVSLHQSVSTAPYFVVTIPPAWEGHGALRTLNRLDVNAWAEQTYGERTIPLADYLSNGALYDAGITRGQADLNAIAAGFNPASFWASAIDKTHFSAPGRAVSAKYLASFVRDGNTFNNANSRFNASSTMDVRVSGSKVTVSGIALDYSDLFNSIQVGVTINAKWMGATMASKPSTHLYAYGIPGEHSYSWTFDLKPGSHFICSVAVGFGAGEHHYPACRSVTVAEPTPPVGSMAIADIGNRTTAIYGWAYDPDRMRDAISVAVLIDGRWFTAVSANGPTPYLSWVPGSHSFWAAAKLSAGQHATCAVAITGSGAMTNLGCQSFTVR